MYDIKKTYVSAWPFYKQVKYCFALEFLSWFIVCIDQIFIVPGSRHCLYCVVSKLQHSYVQLLLLSSNKQTLVCVLSDIKSAVIFSFFLCLFLSFYVAPDISATVTLIGMNFCMMVELLSGHVFSPFGGNIWVILCIAQDMVAELMSARRWCMRQPPVIDCCLWCTMCIWWCR